MWAKIIGIGEDGVKIMRMRITVLSGSLKKKVMMAPFLVLVKNLQCALWGLDRISVVLLRWATGTGRPVIRRAQPSQVHYIFTLTTALQSNARVDSLSRSLTRNPLLTRHCPTAEVLEHIYADYAPKLSRRRHQHTPLPTTLPTVAS